MASSAPEEADVPPGCRLLREGSITVLYEANQDGGEEPVFYNKVQVLNRDLSIRMITLFARHRALEQTTGRAGKQRAYKAKQLAEAAAAAAAEAGEAPPKPVEPPRPFAELTVAEQDERLRAEAPTEGIVILDALAATGLRSCRYYKEIPGVRQVLVNDLDPKAVAAARRNIEHNGLSLDQVTPSQGDANLAMYQSLADPTARPDVIDLDPYGSAAPFIDAAVRAVSEGGMLCVTCTDMAVLAGSHPEACWAKYGSMPTHGKYLHEMALRIVLQSLETTANRYKRHIVPVLSCSIDFYVRLFVRVYTSPAQTKQSCLKSSYVHQSVECPSFHLQPVGKVNAKGTAWHAGTGPAGGGACEETGGPYKIGGPIWNRPIHDFEWVEEAKRDVAAHVEGSFPPISTKDRLHGLLTAVSEELPDVPLYYTVPNLSETLHCSNPPMLDLKSALLNAGYRVSAFHKEPSALKTDAPNSVVWDVFRCWVRKHPVTKKRLDRTSSPGAKILATEPTLEANFARPKGVNAPKTKALRFPPNPDSHWGPKARARGGAKRPPPAPEVPLPSAGGGAAMDEDGQEPLAGPPAKQARNA